MRLRRRKLTELERAQAAERRRLNPPVSWRKRAAVLVVPGLELAALAAVVRGVGLIYWPAAWIVAGLAVGAGLELVGWQQRRAARAAAAQRMTRGDFGL